ncbi:MAG TPA: UDP-N-acetylmuramate dehydrogenase [Flavipsychrobacter sp.]|nr:UDP-N-acetylmuramate dehydrogenase [Flavipsychrobacter sp.]
MHILQNISLQPYNTFGIDVPAEFYVELNNETQIEELSSNQNLPSRKKVLGGGSNILLTKPVEGLLIRNCLKGIVVVAENDEHVWLQVKAGEVWHDLVMHTIHSQLGGLENLSLIPGCVGASPMQNIGAYGVEVKDTISQVVGWHWQEKTFLSLGNEDCRFGYRDSIFKQELKDKLLITSVTFRLTKQHVLNTSYGAIAQELEAMGVTKPTIKSVSQAVINIRSSKLPDPAQIGNAGSFFKNPTISAEQFKKLQTHYPHLPSYPISQSQVKVPAGWLIEQTGWKGYRNGAIGVHEKQALVLVNYGNAKGNDIWNLSEEILQSVKEKFEIELEREVNVW